MAILQGNSSLVLREWAPLTDLLNKLPSKPHLGIFIQDIKITCIDALEEFLALGTNVGVVYWYDRKKKDLQRLRFEKSNTPITRIKAISTVDYMLACGNSAGNINIFQIPKLPPDSIPESLRPKNKPVECYTVVDLHKSAISSLEWSKNGVRLFSGDKTGCIVLTEIDFYMHICKSMEILNETYEVVQLSYFNQKLLVSTTYRSIICQKCDKWNVCQIGKKDRRVLGNFGGLIYQNSLRSDDVVLYCSRPGLRLWISDIEGNVQKTLLFKELLCKERPEVPLINPISQNLRLLKPQKEPSFGVILSFTNNLLITYNNDIIYILDPQQLVVMATVSQLRSVLSVAIHKDEIFILEESRNIVRVSFRPEENPILLDQNVISSTENKFSPLSTSIKDFTSKLQSTSILSSLPTFVENALDNEVDIFTDTDLIVHAEEAYESPIKTQNICEKTFEDIGKEEFNDDILYKHRKKAKKRMTNSISSLSSNNSSEEQNITCSKPTIMNLSTVGVLPDLRSPESIKNDIEYKEKMLAGLLSFDKIKINLDNLAKTKKPSNISGGNHSKDNLFPNISIRKCIPDLSNDSKNGMTNLNHLKSAVENEKYGDKDEKIIPDCRNIPNDWQLSNITLNSVPSTSEILDNSLSDWEIINNRGMAPYHLKSGETKIETQGADVENIGLLKFNVIKHISNYQMGKKERKQSTIKVDTVLDNSETDNSSDWEIV